MSESANTFTTVQPLTKDTYAKKRFEILKKKLKKRG